MVAGYALYDTALARPLFPEHRSAMRYLKRLFSNAGKTYGLQRGYYAATTTVGLAGLFLVTIPLFIAESIGLMLLFGRDSVVVVVLLLPAFFLSLIVGLQLAALLFALVMLMLGHLNAREAVAYVRYGAYPRRWYRPDVTPLSNGGAPEGRRQQKNPHRKTGGGPADP